MTNLTVILVYAAAALCVLEAINMMVGAVRFANRSLHYAMVQHEWKLVRNLGEKWEWNFVRFANHTFGQVTKT